MPSGRRGKLKYRDVVGGGKSRQKDRKIRPRKTVSLFKNKNKSTPRKRKYEDENDRFKTRKRYHDIAKVNDLNIKRQKKEQNMRVVQAQESSESEEENLDYLAKLREAFGIKKGSEQIITSDEDSSEDENGDNESCSDEGVTKSSEYEEVIDSEHDASVDEDQKVSDDESLHSDHNVSDNQDEEVRDNDEDQIDEVEIDIETEKEEIDIESSEDPFVKHLHYELHDSVLNNLKAVPVCVDVFTDTWPKLGDIKIEIPKSQVEIPAAETLLDRKMFAPVGKKPVRLKSSVDPSSLMIKSLISVNVRKANKYLGDLNQGIFTPLQSEIFSILNSYQDFYFPDRTFNNAEQIRFIYCLHAANHIMKTRTKVLHHNAKLKTEDDIPDEFRDQGLVRPKILFIVPFKDAAYKIVNMLIEILLSEDKGNVIKKKRFIEDYTGCEIIMPKKHPKPQDYQLLFSGNTSDDFKIGITVTKKSLKLYANFYSSDIIIASPLGLRTIIGAEGEPERDYDFLASVELLILDQAEVFLMQNLQHLYHIFDHLHLQPKESHGSNYSRARVWSLNGWSQYYRQTLIFSSIDLLELSSIFNKRCLNYAGKVRVINDVASGTICQVCVKLPHTFRNFWASSHSEVFTERFNFFVNQILPRQRDEVNIQTLIYIPDYYDYVRLRNYFNREKIGFAQICEYAEEGKIAKARDMFFHGQVHFLLYTERYHFFNRRRVKGIRHIIFYQPPNVPHFYEEMCNLMMEINMNKKIGTSSHMSVTVLCSKYDGYRLAAIVGTENARNMLSSEKTIHCMNTPV